MVKDSEKQVARTPEETQQQKSNENAHHPNSTTIVEKEVSNIILSPNAMKKLPKGSSSDKVSNNTRELSTMDGCSTNVLLSGVASSFSNSYKTPNSSLAATTITTTTTMDASTMNNNSNAIQMRKDETVLSTPAAEPPVTPYDLTLGGCFADCGGSSSNNRQKYPNAQEKVLLNMPSLLLSLSSPSHHPTASYSVSTLAQRHNDKPDNNNNNSNQKNCLQRIYDCETADCILSPLSKCDQIMTSPLSSVHSSCGISATTCSDDDDDGGSGLNPNDFIMPTTSDFNMYSKGQSSLSCKNSPSQQQHETENGDSIEFGTIEAVRVSKHNVVTTCDDILEHHSNHGDKEEVRSRQQQQQTEYSRGVQPLPSEVPSAEGLHPQDDNEAPKLESTSTVPQNVLDKHQCLMRIEINQTSSQDGEDVETIYVSPSYMLKNQNEIGDAAAAVVAPNQTKSNLQQNSNSSTNTVLKTSSSTPSLSIPFAVDPFAPREGKRLWWERVNMVVKDRIILDHIWGSVPDRQTTAIMGPSGAGKTSLLNVLAGRMRTSSSRRIKVQATVRLNNYEVNPNDMAVRQMIAFVAQDDSLPPTETPREAIRFSAKLRLGRSMTDQQLDDLTEYMLNELGLTSCADTIVGGPLLKGISGGERKRTSVGVELVVKPAMVFLDEPTSGLDAFSAVQVCRLLKKVANAGASVLFTIHQPSSKIFREFDQLILMNKGRVMYQGPVDDVGEYFAARGHPCPMNYNPADWVMKVSQKTPIEVLEEQGFFPRDESDISEPLTCESKPLAATKKNGSGESGLSFWTQVSVLMKREFNHIRRDRKATMIRIFQSILMSSLIGIIFFNVGQASRTSPSNVQSQFGAIVLMSCITMTAPAQTALMAFPTERPIFLREYSTRHYTVVAYFLSRLAMEALICAVQCIIMLTVAFNLIQFQGSFVIFLGACYALGMASTAIAVVLGAAAGSNTKIAACLLPLVLMPQFLFIGYFIVPEMIPFWLRWLRWLCPMAYATRILLVEEFYDCSDNLFEKLGCEVLLNSVEADAENVWWYWLVLAAQFVLFRLTALAVLKHSVKTFY